MTISDIDDPTGCSFFIAHPTKSFVIVAESREVKSLWLRDTFQTIVSCRKRESLRANGQRKMSIIDRIEGQQKSGLVHPPAESTPYVKRSHPRPLPCLHIPKPPRMGSFSSPSSDKQPDVQKNKGTLFPVSLPSNTPAPTPYSKTHSTPMKCPIQALEEDNPQEGVFSTIMQMATLHMDEVELLTATGEGVSPGGSSGLSTPEKSPKASTLATLAKAWHSYEPGDDDDTFPSTSQRKGSEDSIPLQEAPTDSIHPITAQLASESEKRTASKKEAVLIFDKRVANLSEKSLRGLFNAVSTSSLPHFKSHAIVSYDVT